MRKLNSMRKAQGYYYDEHGHLKRGKGRTYAVKLSKEPETKIKQPLAKKKPAAKKPAAKKPAAKKATKK